MSKNLITGSIGSITGMPNASPSSRTLGTGVLWGRPENAAMRATVSVGPVPPQFLSMVQKSPVAPGTVKLVGVDVGNR